MDIKPLATQALLPTTGNVARERVADTFDTPDIRADQDANLHPQRAPAQDPGAARIADDPWGTTPVGERLLMTGGDAPSLQAELADLNLGDAVRGAVDYVFDAVE
ncbi:MAG: hypothetical protein AB8G17_05510 [Gammaproteobacteria bacterium]